MNEWKRKISSRPPSLFTSFFVHHPSVHPSIPSSFLSCESLLERFVQRFSHEMERKWCIFPSTNKAGRDGFDLILGWFLVFCFRFNSWKEWFLHSLVFFFSFTFFDSFHDFPWLVFEMKHSFIHCSSMSLGIFDFPTSLSSFGFPAENHSKRNEQKEGIEESIKKRQKKRKKNTQDMATLREQANNLYTGVGEYFVPILKESQFDEVSPFPSTILSSSNSCPKKKCSFSVSPHHSDKQFRCIFSRPHVMPSFSTTPERCPDTWGIRACRRQPRECLQDMGMVSCDVCLLLQFLIMTFQTKSRRIPSIPPWHTELILVIPSFAGNSSTLPGRVDLRKHGRIIFRQTSNTSSQGMVCFVSSFLLSFVLRCFSRRAFSFSHPLLPSLLSVSVSLFLFFLFIQSLVDSESQISPK